MITKQSSLGHHGIIVYENKLLLMLRDDKPDIPDPNMWCLIGGTEEPGELPFQTFLRECEEEMGVEPKNWRHLMTKPTRKGELFFSRLNEAEFKQIRLGDEGQELRFFEFEEIEGIPLAGVSTRILYKEYRELLEKLLRTS